jgi:3-phosphoshikimate 1-carboxyvinyltransferase
MALHGRLLVRGVVDVPGDKSVSHRALILAALARGSSRIHGILRSEDIESTAHVLRTLGVDVPPLSERMTVGGRGLNGLLAPATNLNCGNSGTTVRLMMGVTAAQSFPCTFTGDVSLSRRPMRRVSAPLEAMGARVEFLNADDGLPLVMHGGRLSPIEWRLETASAQVKSAILLAGLCAGVPVLVHEPAPSRDHTERFLRAQGAAIRWGNGRIELDPGGSVAPLDVQVPGDPSAAAFFAALGALADDGAVTLRGVDLNPGRTGFVNVLRRMGADITVENGIESGPEPIGDLIARPGILRATSIGPDEVPSLIDELPVLACVAARADGETAITGAAELRVKESDRIASVVANLRAIGVLADELPDGMRVVGTRAPLKGLIRTHGDHRVAMAFGILGSSAATELAIDDPACVSVSYPHFWRDLAGVTA